MKERHRSPWSVAGWLFADSLLMLMVIGMASEPAVPLAVKQATPVPSASVPAVPAPSGTAKSARPPAVEQKPVVVVLPRGATEKAVLRTAFGVQLRSRRRAAFVLTFGTAVRPGDGVQRARAVNARLRKALPQLFGGSAQRSYWQAVDAQNPPGSVRVELFLFTEPESGAG